MVAGDHHGRARRRARDVQVEPVALALTNYNLVFDVASVDLAGAFHITTHRRV